ncbi:putative reverse transcriptase [Senna tora]|uniref:Putative reverse transcriptase n=1 Tax=Senna tora TaxID=362788 RepID=A0A834XGJ2_9FABA|nr:putative reverse transcriptase [Senna tora]
MTEVARKHRKISDSDICQRCGLLSESALHAMRDCVNHNQNWGCVFGIACWFVWKQRNGWVFSNKCENATAFIPVIEIQVDELRVNVMSKVNDMENHNSDNNTAWKAPPNGWVKINVDGSHMPGRNLISCGGVARNSKGEWICGFTKNMGRGLTIQAELWGILTGLNMAWHQNFRKVIIETDSVAAMEVAQGIITESPMWKVLATRIQDLRCKDWNTALSYSPREGNRVADILAKSTLSMPLGDRFLLRAPDMCHVVLSRDVEGLDSVYCSPC